MNNETENNTDVFNQLNWNLSTDASKTLWMLLCCQAQEINFKLKAQPGNEKPRMQPGHRFSWRDHGDIGRGQGGARNQSLPQMPLFEQKG